MYSRAPRKFLEPDADHANPNLGPGCYTSDDHYLASGKLLGDDGYAPFLSLAKRVSAFDETVGTNPAPGEYDTTLTTVGSNLSPKAPLFGRSRSNRFKNSVSATPGPGAYQIPSPLKGLAGSNKTKPKQVFHRLNVLEKSIDSVKEIITPHETIENNLSSVSESHLPNKKENLGELTGHSAVRKEGSASSQSRLRKQKIVWRRKYVPPSIPVGPTTYGYQETRSGDLVPRRAPLRRTNSEPAYNCNTSFAEKARKEGRGFKFGSTKERLVFKPTVSLGPGAYDVVASDSFLHGHSESSSGPAVMTLAPCVRLTDVVIKQEMKKGIPGPGYYDVKEDLIQRKKYGKINFGGSVAHRLAKYDVSAEPGPGQYHPEIAETKKPISQKQQPFGTTSQRFNKLTQSKNSPAPGSYNVDQLNSIVHNVQTRAQIGNGINYKAFGSIAGRFKPEKQVSVSPGPGSYNPDLPNKVPLGFSAYNYMHHFNSPKNQKLAEPITESQEDVQASGNKRAQVKMVVRKGPHLKIVISDVVANPSKVHVPAFGSQLDRFGEEGSKSGPPPGAYEVSSSYLAVKTKGGVSKSTLDSQTKRQVFEVHEINPGPGEYNPQKLDKHISSVKGTFLGTKNRFEDNEEAKELPAPNCYQKNGDHLIRKTFNITLGSQLVK